MKPSRAWIGGALVGAVVVLAVGVALHAHRRRTAASAAVAAGTAAAATPRATAATPVATNPAAPAAMPAATPAATRPATGTRAATATPAATIAAAATSVASAAIAADACAVASIAKVGLNDAGDWSPATNRVAVARPDGQGVYQVVTQNPDGSGRTCVSCAPPAGSGAPTASDWKIDPTWSPSGRWLVMAAEDTHHPEPATLQSTFRRDALLHNGWWAELWVASADGSRWYRLTDYAAGGRPYWGVLHPHFSHDGTQLVWASLVGLPGGATGTRNASPTTRASSFGSWQLDVASIAFDAGGVPHLGPVHDLTPPGSAFNEPFGFTPDDASVIFSSDLHTTPFGFDLYTENLATRALTDLTNTPGQWDEHAAYSPSGRRIAWMTSLPYASSGTAQEGTLRTEIMLMNADGSGARQVTHFNQRGYPESGQARSIAGISAWSPDGHRLLVEQLLTGNAYPNNETWLVTFAGDCGGPPRRGG